MESKTYLKNLKMSPKKLRFFLPELKKKKPMMALDHLLYAPQQAAKMLYFAIKSALNNAKNTLKVPENLLEWKLFTVEEGQKLKRYKPGGRGTAKPFKIRSSHVKIILSTLKPADELKKQEVKEEKIASKVPAKKPIAQTQAKIKK